MSIERCGHFIEFQGDDGIRYVARATAIQLLADVDEMRSEAYVTIAGRTILVRSPLEEFRAALLDDSAQGVRGRVA